MIRSRPQIVGGGRGVLGHEETVVAKVEKPVFLAVGEMGVGQWGSFLGQQAVLQWS